MNPNFPNQQNNEEGDAPSGMPIDNASNSASQPFQQSLSSSDFEPQSRFSQSQSPTQPPPSQDFPEEKEGLLKIFSILEKVLAVGFVAGVFLIAVFGALNYFNILSLSSSFPDQFGWLPRKESAQKINNSKIIISSDVKKPNQILIDFLPKILTDSFMFLSSSIILEQDSINKNIFNGILDAKEHRVRIAMELSDGLRKINSFEFDIEKLNVPAIISTESAKLEVSQIFSVKPKGKWICYNTVLNTRIYCENFWEESENSKKGVGFFILNTRAKRNRVVQSRVILSFCEHTKESDRYEWKSCAKEFSENGVR